MSDRDDNHHLHLGTPRTRSKGSPIMDASDLPPIRRSPNKAKKAKTIAAVVRKLGTQGGSQASDVDAHSPGDLTAFHPEDVDDSVPPVEDAQVDTKVDVKGKGKAKVETKYRVGLPPPVPVSHLAFYDGYPIGPVTPEFASSDFDPANIVKLFSTAGRRIHSFRSPVSMLRWQNGPRESHHEYTLVLPFIALRSTHYDIFGLNRFPVAYSDSFLNVIRRRWVSVVDGAQYRHTATAITKIMETPSPIRYTGTNRCQRCIKDDVECYDVGGGCAYCHTFGALGSCGLNAPAIKEAQAQRDQGSEALFHFSAHIVSRLERLRKDLASFGPVVDKAIRDVIYSLDEPLATVARTLGFELDPTRLAQILKRNRSSRTFLAAAVSNEVISKREFKLAREGLFIGPAAEASSSKTKIEDYEGGDDEEKMEGIEEMGGVEEVASSGDEDEVVME